MNIRDNSSGYPDCDGTMLWSGDNVELVSHHELWGLYSTWFGSWVLGVIYCHPIPERAVGEVIHFILNGHPKPIKVGLEFKLKGKTLYCQAISCEIRKVQIEGKEG